MARTLEPEDEISHYRIVAPLGAGGMGEVYAARDETLGRSVALKILPPDLVRNDERVRRFVTEAKSASSLNHPNIVTIYEIGRDVPRKAQGTARPAATTPGDSIYFIAMELVTGGTLDRAIHDDRADLRSVVGWLAQAAEGIAKAHAAGIVHRDLKPGNIMVSKDGFSKVLDFGLAKLTEKAAPADADRTSLSTAMANTGAGAVMGTVGYMSPEQVQAKPVDHRSDIFSLGCILYEAATGRRPFAADSDVEVMHRILKEPPAPMETLNPAVPGELRRVVRRCLAKSPDERFQSMKDVAIELREMFETWETLSPSHPSAGSSASGAVPAGSAAARGGRGFWAAIVAAALLGLGGIGFGLETLLRHGAPGAAAREAAPNLRISVLMSLQDLNTRGSLVLSADGRYIAYATTHDRFNSLKVRQVRTGSDVVIIADSDQTISGVQFSRDGDYLYYTSPDPQTPTYQALFQVPSLGGTPRKVLYDVDSAPTFSPDGKSACFRRGLLGSAEDSLVVADLNGGPEREILRIKGPSAFVAAPDWSPDGASIATGIQNPLGGVKTSIEIIDVASGRHAPLGTRGWVFVQSVRWMPDGRSLLASAFDLEEGGVLQIFRIAWPDGDTVRLTTDLDGYSNLSVAADGSSVAAVRNVTVNNVWAARLGSGWSAQPVTSVAGSSGSVRDVVPLPKNMTAYTAPLENRFFLWLIGADGTSRKQMTRDGVFVINALYAPEAGIVFTRVDAGKEVTGHIWRVDPDGGGLRQVTSGPGETMHDLSHRGDVVLYERWDDEHSIWVVGAGGGSPRKIVDGRSIGQGLLSPDGGRVIFPRLEKNSDKLREVREVVSVNGDTVQPFVDLPPGIMRVAWTPDGRGVTYIDRRQGWNLFRKTLPDGPAEPLTRFTDGQVGAYTWSPDGAWLAFERRVGQQDSLWMMKPGESRPAMVTEFKGGLMRQGVWAPDAPIFYFVYGTSTQDVVLLSGIR